VSLLSAWALAGLILAVPLVVLHLRRRSAPLHDVASLMAWREISGQASPSSRRFGRPVMPLLLLLQLLALALLVFSLARPASGLERAPSSRIYVIDDSVWMQARRGGVSRLAAAEHAVRLQLAQLPGHTDVRIITAGATPSRFFSGSPQAAAQAIAHLEPTQGAGDLAAALRLAAGLRNRADDRVELLRAPEDTPPSVQAGAGTFSQVVIGAALDDQGLTDAVARCGLPGPSPCEAFARVRNTGSRTQDDRVLVLVDGRQADALTVAVAPGSSSPVALHVPVGATLELRLESQDALPADDTAFIAVPAEAPVRVTLVGNPSRALPLAGALAAAPGVQLRLRTPTTYRSTDPETSDLLVLDDWLPAGGLPAAPSILLVAPPRLPGGRVDGFLTDSRVSASDPTSALLNDVDLTSLTIDSHQARKLTPPSWMPASVSSPEGPLLAAGSTADQRVALLAFDPTDSDLPQLESFPLLVSNVVSWSQEWAPAQASAGQAVLVQEPPGTTSATLTGDGEGTLRLPVSSSRAHALTLAKPGLYTIHQRGPWGTRNKMLAVNVDTAPSSPSPSPVQLSAAPSTVGSNRTPWWPWVLAAALIVLILEWAYALRSEPRLLGS
jgi:hypothetical protein